MTNLLSDYDIIDIVENKYPALIAQFEKLKKKNENELMKQSEEIRRLKKENKEQKEKYLEIIQRLENEKFKLEKKSHEE